MFPLSILLEVVLGSPTFQKRLHDSLEVGLDGRTVRDEPNGKKILILKIGGCRSEFFYHVT